MRGQLGKPIAFQAFRIVFVGPFGLQPKGTMSVRALPMAKALVQRGHQVTMVIPPWDDPTRSGKVWDDDGVEIVHVDLPPSVPGLFHGWLTKRLVDEVLKRQPEVVHCFKPKAYAGLTHWVLWWLRRLKRHKMRLVIDTDDWEQAWNEVNPYSENQKRFFSWQEGWGLSNADTITAASHTLARMVRHEGTKMEAATRKVFYLPNGSRTELSEIPVVSSERIAKIRQDMTLGSAPTVLLYSRFGEFRLRRITTLVWYVSEYLPAARWLIVGKGLRGEELALQHELNESGLLEYVRFAGWVPAEELNAYFQAADVAVHPYDDTLINRTKCSVKLIDLLSVGLPVVADAVGQNLDYIRDNQSGVLIKNEDDAEFGQAIIDLLSQPTLRQTMGAVAQNHVKENFSWSKLVKIVEQAYQA